MNGTVLWSSNSIYYILCQNEIVKCNIKGKVLKVSADFLNPICIGDEVDFEKIENDKGLILNLYPRKNYFFRYFSKKSKTGKNLIASNLDCLMILISSKEPSIRYAFLDRILSVCQIENINPFIVVNKIDLNIDDYDLKRLQYLQKLGYKVFFVSALKNKGFDQVLGFVSNKRTLIVGQSGVGKSSFVNSVFKDKVTKIGDVSKKYNRGVHTTTMSKTYIYKNSFIIDSPGMKEFAFYPYNILNITHSFLEFKDINCNFKNCSHTNEKDCLISQNIDDFDEIFLSRYINYLNIVEEIGLDKRIEKKQK